MIPDRNAITTLFIKNEDGEYQELGKTTSVEYECAVGEIPTLRLELHCNYEQNKKEKEEKEMTYDELVKKLPKIEIDGVPIEYGKTKVIYTYADIDYEGLIVYNDGSGGNELIFVSDERCADFNDELCGVNSDIERVLKRTFDEKTFEYRNYWVYIESLKLAPQKTDIHITTSSGLKIDTTGLTAISSDIDYPYVTYDYVKYDIDHTNDFYEKYYLGMWNTEEKKERGNNMQLINIFEQKSKHNIAKYYNDEIQKYKNENKLKSQFEAIVKEANEKIRKLYETQSLNDNLYTIVENPALDTQIQYKLTYTEVDDTIKSIREQKNDELSKINDLLNEVNAQIECIEEHSDNEYEEIMKVLKDYGIVNEKGKVTPIDIKPRHIFDDTKENIRGRKPSKKSE